jgi:chlorophyll(ide) b reductase
MKTVEAVVKVNLMGVLFCTKVAMDIMGQQAGVNGHIFNTVGSGVKGGGTPGYACYGATKRGLPQLTATLVKELDEGVQGFDKKETPGKISVHSMSPGMVFTKLLLEDSTPELRKFPFGVLAAQPEEVAADLVPKILSATQNGSSVEFLTTDRILTKFFERFILQQKSEYIDDVSLQLGRHRQCPVCAILLSVPVSHLLGLYPYLLHRTAMSFKCPVHNTTSWVSAPCTKRGGAAEIQ